MRKHDRRSQPPKKKTIRKGSTKKEKGSKPRRTPPRAAKPTAGEQCVASASSSAAPRGRNTSATSTKSRRMTVPAKDRPGVARVMTKAGEEVLEPALHAVHDVRTPMPVALCPNDAADRASTTQGADLEAMDEAKPVLNPPAGRRSYARSLEGLAADPELLAPVRITVPRVAAAGHVTLLAAREKMGKSTLSAACAAEVSRGGTLFGEPVPQGRVLWVGLEENLGHATRRFVELGASRNNVYLLDRLAGEGGLSQLIAEIEAVGADLIVLDSLAAYARGIEDENSAVACTALLTPLVQYIHDSARTLIILHHANKAGNGYRGSVAIGASVDAILEMKEGDTPRGRRIEAKGRFPLEGFDCILDVESMTWRLADEEPSAEEKRAELQESVLSYLRETPGAGKAQLREAMRRNARETDLALEALVESGRVRHLGHRAGYAVAGVMEAAA